MSPTWLRYDRYMRAVRTSTIHTVSSYGTADTMHTRALHFTYCTTLCTAPHFTERSRTLLCYTAVRGIVQRGLVRYWGEQL